MRLTQGMLFKQELVSRGFTALSDDQPTAEDHGAVLPFLIRKRRFAEVMILAWQSVEDLVDQMTVQEFDLFYAPDKEDPRVDILRDRVGFETKLKFLKEMGRLSSNDTRTISDFALERHKLFHGYVFSNHSPGTIPEDEKTRLMNQAGRASQITTNRGFGTWYDEGTGDIGNKDVPKPERHPAIKRNQEIRMLFATTLGTAKNPDEAI
jgi:hypothetical protein